MLRSLSLLFCTSLLLAHTGKVQAQIQDKTSFTFEVKKTTPRHYTITAHAKLEKGWHVYSMTPGGDGSLIPVAIDFDSANSAKLIGKIEEKGKLISKTMVGIDGIVNMYENNIDYIQKVEGNEGAVVSGSYTYQICGETICLPPTTKNFKVTLK